MDDRDLEFLLSPPSQWPEYYGYQPLDSTSNEIRLLQLSLSPQESQLHARLTTVSLNDTPRYEALSYYWGPPGEQISIFIDGVDVKIRATLHACLYNLCTMGQTLPLWVDSLCINQRDSAERNQQVSMMGEIYKTAIRVKSWLGKADADTDYTFAYIRHRNEQALLSSPELESILHRVRESTLQIARRPYWTRVWIVQEIGLAQDLQVVCGRRSVAWYDLMDVIKSVHGATLQAVELSSKEIEQYDRAEAENVRVAKTIYVVLQPLLTLEELRQSLHSKPSAAPKSLLDTISRFADHHCFDARDKAYGFRSISKYGDRLPMDYGRPMVEVFFDVLKTNPDWWEHVPNAILNGTLRASAAKDVLQAFSKQRPANDLFAELETTEDASLRSRLSFDAKANSDLFRYQAITLHQVRTDLSNFVQNPQRLVLAPGDIVCDSQYPNSAKDGGDRAARIVIRVDASQKELYLAGMIRMSLGYEFYHGSGMIPRGEIQLCRQAKYEASTATVILFLHHSRCSLLAACVSRLQVGVFVDGNRRRFVDTYRQRHPLPQLCTCTTEDDSERLQAIRAMEQISEALRQDYIA